jgi:hypothetical protein
MESTVVQVATVRGTVHKNTRSGLPACDKSAQGGAQSEFGFIRSHGDFIGKACSDGADYRLPGEVRRPPRQCTRWLLQPERGVPASENRRRTRQDGLPQQIDRRQGKPSCFLRK